MNLKEIEVTTNSKGEISCGYIEISTDEWYDILKQPEASKYVNEQYCILRMPDHKTSCKPLSEKYGLKFQHYNSMIKAFSQ